MTDCNVTGTKSLCAVVVIKKIEDSPFTLEDVYHLIKEIYHEREAVGISYYVSRASLEEYLHNVKGSEVYVAINQNSGMMIGSARLKVVRRGGKTVGIMLNAAVLKAYQRHHVGTMLFEARKKDAVQQGCHHLLCTTATTAFSSISWHEKIGYRRVGYKLGTHGFDSYLYYMPLTNYDLYHVKIFCQARYWLTFLLCKFIPGRLYRHLR